MTADTQRYGFGDGEALPVDEWRVRFDGQEEQIAAAGEPLILTGLKPGTLYYCRVAGVQLPETTRRWLRRRRRRWIWASIGITLGAMLGIATGALAVYGIWLVS